MNKETFKGFLFGVGLLVGAFLLSIGVEEYIYFQQLKAEHQEMAKTLLEVLGKDKSNQPYTRGKFLEDFSLEVIRQNSKKDP